MGVTTYSWHSSTGVDLYFPGGNSGRCHRVGNVIGYSYYMGSCIDYAFVSIMLFTNSYKKIERSIIAFVSVIGLSFIYELFLVEIDCTRLQRRGG